MLNTLGLLDNSPIFVHALEFGDNEMTFHFQENREVTDAVMIARTMKILIDTEEKQELYLRLQEFASYCIDAGYVELRNPEPPAGE